MIRSRYGWGLAACAGLVLGACAELEPLPADVDGVWKARRPGGGKSIRLDMYQGPMGRRGTEHVHLRVAVGEIDGLDEDAFRGTEPLEFRLERDPGVFVFEGARQRRPRGSFVFEPSPDFVRRIEQLGVSEIGNERLMKLAFHGVSAELIEALLTSGYRDSDPDDFVRLHSYGLRPEWIVSMSRLAGPPRFGELISLRNYGIRESHVDRWIAAGIGDLEVDDLVRLYLHGFDSSDAPLYREHGFDDVDAWLKFYRNGVSMDLIGAVVESGAREKDVEAILQLYVVGVGAGDIEEAASLIEAGFDWEALIYLWRRGVKTDYAEALLDTGWDSREIAQLAANGLDSDWIRRVRAVGGGDLDIDDLVRLRHYGVSAGDFERYASAGFTASEEIRSFVSAGVEPEWIPPVLDYVSGDLEADDLVRLQQNGVDKRFLQRLADAGFDSLEVDDLIEARHMGLDRWLERQQL